MKGKRFQPGHRPKLRPVHSLTPRVALKQERHVIPRGPAHRSASLFFPARLLSTHTTSPSFLAWISHAAASAYLFFSDAIAVELLHGAPSPTKRGAAGVVAAARDAIAMAERDGAEHRRYYDRGPWSASSQARAAMATSSRHVTTTPDLLPCLFLLEPVY